MSITKDGNGRIVYTAPLNEARNELSGTVVDSEFAIVDDSNVLKQIKFRVASANVTPAIITLKVTADADSEVDLTAIPDPATYIDQNVVDGETDKAPSGNAVFDALALKATTTDILKQTITSGVTTSAPSQDAVFNALALKATTTDILKQTITNGVTTSAPSQDAVFDALYQAPTSVAANNVAVSSNVSVGISDKVLWVNTTAARSITLPDPSILRSFTIKDVSGLAGTNNITLIRFASEQIEGIAASRVLASDWGSWTVTTNGTNWFITW